MRKRPIPPVPRSAGEHGRTAFDSAVKEDLELIMGQRGSTITPLADTSTSDDILAKINEIIERLQ
jgi:hypothetical protein